MEVETITQLTIMGFKSIRSLENFELRRFNVLIGANGVGKSNIIDFFQMLKFMFSSTQGSLRLYVAQRGGSNSLLHYYGLKKSRNLNAAIEFSGNQSWSRFSFSMFSGPPVALYFENENLEYKLEGDNSVFSKQVKNSGSQESQIFSQTDPENDSGTGFDSTSIRKLISQFQVYHFHDTSETANIRLAQDIDRDDHLMSHADNLAVFLYNLKKDRPSHFKRILSTVQLIAPFIRDFVVEPQATEHRFVLLRWMDGSGETFGPHQLSDGTIRAIALITALLQPNETMPSIMIFDEPELGLHPAAIALVANLLKAASEKRQVIVATQSPILIRDYEPEDVIVAERTEDDLGRGESTFKRLERDSLAAWLEDYDLGELYEKNVTGGYPK